MFRGIGGFDLAMQNLGHELVGGCEIDKYANQVFDRHFKGIPNDMDATKIRPEELPDFDILTAGFPCQTFSIAGKRLGFEESRGTLFFEIARIARQKRPRLLFLENVVGLLSHDRGRTFAEILAALDEIGYDAEWQVFNSKYFVPQNMERIFIVGHLRNKPTPKIFPIKKDGGLFAKEQEPTTVRTITGGGHSGGLHSQMTILYENKSDSQARRIYKTDGISPTLGIGHAMQSPNICIPVLTPERSNKRQNGRRFKEDGDPSFTLTTQDKHGVLIVPDNFKHEAGKPETRQHHLSNIHPALQANTGNTQATYLLREQKIRRLTPLECERLQGFPDGWTDGISDTQRYKCLGNAVTVSVVEFIMKHFDTTNIYNGED